MSSTSEVISHWSALIENLDASPQEFYEALTAAIKKRQIPTARLDRISLKEGNLFSAKREYLRIRCKEDFYFAICGAPFGTGFFVSWWLMQPPAGCLAALFANFPVLSALARGMVRPWTCYRIDTATMFRTATHQAVLEVVDELIAGSGIRELSEAERKPAMKEFFLQS